MNDKTAVIICNGPSLRSVPDSWLDKYYTFGSNRVWLRYAPKHLTTVDVKMVYTAPLATSMIAGAARSEKVTFSKDVANILVPYYPDEEIPDGFEVLPWFNYFEGETTKLLLVFAPEPGTPLVSGGTVTYGMMQLAWRMGFRRLLIVGMNHTFRDPRGDHMHPDYNKEVGIPYEKEHTDPAVVGYGAGNWFWSEENFVKKTNIFYDVARRFFEKNGGEIINCTPDTKCTIFPVRDWRNF